MSVWSSGSPEAFPFPLLLDDMLVILVIKATSLQNKEFFPNPFTWFAIGNLTIHPNNESFYIQESDSTFAQVENLFPE